MGEGWGSLMGLLAVVDVNMRLDLTPVLHKFTILQRREEK